MSRRSAPIAIHRRSITTEASRSNALTVRPLRVRIQRLRGLIPRPAAAIPLLRAPIPRRAPATVVVAMAVIVAAEAALAVVVPAAVATAAAGDTAAGAVAPVAVADTMAVAAEVEVAVAVAAAVAEAPMEAGVPSLTAAGTNFIIGTRKSPPGISGGFFAFRTRCSG